MSVAPAQKIGLTKRNIEELECPAGKDRVYVFDAKTPALAVCKTRTGATSFYLYKRVAGRPTRIRLGGWPELTVEQARDLCAKKNLAIANGVNPQAEKQTAREELTVSQTFDLYIERHAKPHKKTWPEDRRILDKYASTIKGKRLSGVTTGHLATLHAKIGKDHGPYQANRLMEVLQSVFARAMEWKLTAENPVKGVQPFPERERERFVQPDEMPRFLAAVRAEENETLRDFILMALWTGQRRGNVQAMKWEHISLTRCEWIIPAEETKTGEVYRIPLIAPAIEILTQRRSVQAKSENDNYRDSKYVFPGRFGRGHLLEPKGAWKRIITKAGIDDLRIHDLRRTLGSWQAAAGTSLQIIGKSLGHSHHNQAATAIYARLNLDPVRLAVNGAVQAMLAAEPATAKTATEEK